MDLSDAWTTLDQQDAEKWRWLEGPRISFDDVNSGTGRVQRITAAQWFAVGGQQGPVATAGGFRPAAKVSRNVFHFGKHRGRLYADVRDEDPTYWAWCLREVNGFAAKARKAGSVNEHNENPAGSPNDEWSQQEGEAENADPDCPYANGSWVPNR